MSVALARPAAVRPLRVRMIVAWGIALALGAAVYHLADFAARTLPRSSPLEELAYYPSGRNVRVASLGHGEVAADVAWLRAVQYYGAHRKKDNRFEHLEHVFDILTTLSPRFESAYVFGAFALAQEGQDFPAAERLILKGLENNPRSGRLAFEAGFLYYVKPNGRDLVHAAEYFELAARLPGAPASAREFAAFSHQNTGSLAVAWQLWKQIRETTGNQYLKELAEKEMGRIQTALETGRADLVKARLGTPRVVLH
ncbi:MAG: hypothetical protein HZA61_08510 [Candidatus Eisenbacteria bacterium]|uniref:Tetratricopeptide repeat protein n=1 Tax=Eiseniibacteriota bacterium TaxID=2212470 RepID=A0A933SD57_UNCEI|nr:hypothetical protein [Candidatus Eisenbacteria bacterium]